MSSNFGHIVKISIFGQSHGEAIGVVMDGLPAGEKIDLERIAAFMARRAPGSAGMTQRKEKDQVRVLSGLVDGFTCEKASIAVQIAGVDGFPMNVAGKILKYKMREDAVKKLRANGLDKVVLEEAAKGKPLLGICLGMQLLFEESHEYGVHKGLGLIPGRVVPLEGYVPSDLKIPHIGWNPLILKGEGKHPLLKYVEEGDCVYFVHSYFATDCQESVIATAEYGKELTAAVANKNVFGCQFHPEKSGTVGLKILRAFAQMEG